MHIELILGIIVITIGTVIFFLGSRRINESNILSTYVPIDDINSIPFEIPTVINGTVTADQPLIAPVTKKPCVYYKYLLEREEETKTRAGNSVWIWKQVGSTQSQTIPFYLQDNNGKILIKPENCEINNIYHTQQFLEPGTIQNVSTGLKLIADVFQFDSSDMATVGNRERVTEYVILTGSNLNVFGIITLEGNQKFIQKTKDYPLVLSPLSKDQLVGSEKKSAYIMFGLAALLLILGIYLSLHA